MEVTRLAIPSSPGITPKVSVSSDLSPSSLSSTSSSRSTSSDHGTVQDSPLSRNNDHSQSSSSPSLNPQQHQRSQRHKTIIAFSDPMIQTIKAIGDEARTTEKKRESERSSNSGESISPVQGPDPGEGQFTSALSMRLLSRRMIHTANSEEVKALFDTIRVESDTPNGWSRISWDEWRAIRDAIRAFSSEGHLESSPVDVQREYDGAKSSQRILIIVQSRDDNHALSRQEWFSCHISTTSGVYLVSGRKKKNYRLIRLPEHGTVDAASDTDETETPSPPPLQRATAAEQQLSEFAS